MKEKFTIVKKKLILKNIDGMSHFIMKTMILHYLLQQRELYLHIIYFKSKKLLFINKERK